MVATGSKHKDSASASHVHDPDRCRSVASFQFALPSHPDFDQSTRTVPGGAAIKFTTKYSGLTPFFFIPTFHVSLIICNANR